MDVTPAYASEIDADHNISRVLEFRYWAVFVDDFVGLMENEGRVLDA